jgi:hypothetical protein
MVPQLPSRFRTVKGVRDFLVMMDTSMSIVPANLTGQHASFGMITSRRASRVEIERMLTELRESGRRARGA